jgi:homoserine dehydrogenase
MSKNLRLGIAGLGTVDAGVLDILAKHGGLIASRVSVKLELTAVSARNRGKNLGYDLSKLVWFDNAVKLAQSPDIDVFIELIGGEGDPAKAAVEAALKAGKPVVTANKALLAHHGAGLARLAEDKGVALNFEAAVAGGIPIVKTLRESLALRTAGRARRRPGRSRYGR